MSETRSANSIWQYYINGEKINNLKCYCIEHDLNLYGVVGASRRKSGNYLYKKQWLIERKLKNAKK